MCNYVGAKIPHKWEEFGTFVKVKSGDLKALVGSKPNNRRAFTEVFDRWYCGQTSDYTWEKVAEALESSIVGEKQLLKHLYEKLAKNNAGTF